MNSERPRSLSARQIIGLIFIYMGLSQFMGIAIMVVYTFLQYLADNILFPTDTYIQRLVLAILFVLVSGIGFILCLVGFFMLRDKKGKYIRWIRN